MRRVYNSYNAIKSQENEILTDIYKLFVEKVDLDSNKYGNIVAQLNAHAKQDYTNINIRNEKIETYQTIIADSITTNDLNDFILSILLNRGLYIYANTKDYIEWKTLLYGLTDDKKMLVFYYYLKYLPLVYLREKGIVEMKYYILQVNDFSPKNNWFENLDAYHELKIFMKLYSEDYEVNVIENILTNKFFNSNKLWQEGELVKFVDSED